MATTKRAKSKKITLTDLAPKPYTFELEHPVHGKLGVEMVIVGYDSLEFITASTALSKDEGGKKVADMEATEIMQQTAKLYASLVKGWSDDEFFGGEFSKEKVKEIFCDLNNQFIVNQIESICNEREHFFTKK